MDRNTELHYWQEIADSDLTAAKYLSQYMQPISYEIICFHCQQAVEKYLKWFLVLHDIEPPKTHDLEELEKQCEAIHTSFSEIYEKCSMLSKYAVRSRYPNEIQTEKQDMDVAFEYTNDIRNFFREQFPEKFNKGNL